MNADRARRVFVCTVFATALTGCAPATQLAVTHEPAMAHRPARRDAEAAYLRLPLRFEPAPNESAGAQAFVSRGRGFILKVSSTGAMFGLRAATGDTPAILNMRLAGARQAPATPHRRLQGVSHYVQGRDRTTWRLGVPGYAEVQCDRVYPGVDVVFYGNQQTLEYDFRIAPGADPSAIALQFDASPRIDAAGNLVLQTAAGELVQHAPVMYQLTGGTRRSVDGGYVIRGDGSVGFRVGPYDEQRPLVIDPILTYSTFLGGSRQERGNDVAIDPWGQMIVVGETFSDDFPTVSPEQPSRHGYGDVFVAKLTADGSALVYATYLGGRDYDQAPSVATDASGAAYVVGYTFSSDFPATTSLVGQFHSENAFVAKLDAAGALVYSTLIGGSTEDVGTAIAVDASGRAHITGATFSADFPTVAAEQHSLSGYPIFRSTDGARTWTGVGAGIATEATRSFAFDTGAQPQTMYAGTNLYGVFKSVDGGTTWTRPLNANLQAGPVLSMAVGTGSPAALYAATWAGVFRSEDQGENWTDTQLGADASSVVVLPDTPSTVYAGTLSSWGDGVFRSVDGGMTWTGTGLPGDVATLAASGSTVFAVMSDGGVYRTVDGGSWTAANNGLSQVIAFAVSPNPDIAYAGTWDGFFATTDGGATWSPVLLGAAVGGIVFAPSDPRTIYLFTFSGETAVTHDGGTTWEPAGAFTGSPYTIAVDPESASTVFVGNSLTWDAFVATLSADGSTLEQSTYLGGTSVDWATGIALDGGGSAYIVGETHSVDFPVRQAVQPANGGLRDVFVTKLSPAGSIEYSTYLGGWGSEYAGRVAVDGTGRAYVTGLTWSQNFPVFDAAQASPGGGYSDTFVTALSEAGNSFVYSTYLGGSGMEIYSPGGTGPDIAVTPSGHAFVIGSTKSSDFPVTADAFQRTPSGGETDGFVTSFDGAGRVQYSTFFGGTGADYPVGIAVDTAGGVVIAGWTDSADLPLVDGVQPSYAGFEDAFLARVVPGAGDSTPPHSEINVSGTAGLNGWYVSPVAITVSAQDDLTGRGVRTIEYSLNGGPFQLYTGPFTIATEGATSVAARATDLANNLETPGPTVLVRIDTAGPVVTIASPQPRDYSHTAALSVSVSAADETSGMAGTPTTTLDGTIVAATTVNLLALHLGDHRFEAAATDVAGNLSRVSVSFRVIATIDSLIEAAGVYNTSGAIESGTYRGLLAKLTDAKSAYERGNVEVARAKLSDFISQCTASSGRGISTGAAEVLIADAQWVLDRL